MLAKRVCLPALFVAIFSLVTTDARALTIGGEEYTKVLSFTSANDFGYWTKGLKWFTFQGDNDYVKPNNIASVTYRDNSLAGITFSQVLAMGTIASRNVTDTAVTGGSVALYGQNNQVLLTAEYQSAGRLQAVSVPGTAGELDVFGIFRVTGGSLFTSSAIFGNLFIDISFNNIWRNNTADGDIRANQGTFTFYQRGTPTGETEVPEPATLMLVATSLLGGARLRRKAAA